LSEINLADRARIILALFFGSGAGQKLFLRGFVLNWDIYFCIGLIFEQSYEAIDSYLYLRENVII
jgi:hypothetical protein